jgi:predicted unusual protein kinase regulating ubiquinone biosynthesis (AarF/ABC1/UbiB family)
LSATWRLRVQDFLENFQNDAKVKIPWVRRDLCSQRVLVMEWINGRRCTDPRGIRSSGLNVNNFIRGGVVSALRQLLEVGAALCAVLHHFHLLSCERMHGWARD